MPLKKLDYSREDRKEILIKRIKKRAEQEKAKPERILEQIRKRENGGPYSAFPERIIELNKTRGISEEYVNDCLMGEFSFKPRLDYKGVLKILSKYSEEGDKLAGKALEKLMKLEDLGRGELDQRITIRNIAEKIVLRQIHEQSEYDGYYKKISKFL